MYATMLTKSNVLLKRLIGNWMKTRYIENLRTSFDNKSCVTFSVRWMIRVYNNFHKLMSIIQNMLTNMWWRLRWSSLSNKPHWLMHFCYSQCGINSFERWALLWNINGYENISIKFNSHKMWPSRRYTVKCESIQLLSEIISRMCSGLLKYIKCHLIFKWLPNIYQWNLNRRHSYY